VIIGPKWTPQIMRELLRHDRRRFQDLIDSLPRIAPNTLSHRPKLLEKYGLQVREFYEVNPPRSEYVLTRKGRAMSGVISAMRDWGERFTGVEDSSGPAACAGALLVSCYTVP
jgi:DNA-binding HxlR family transcriptional regulator